MTVREAMAARGYQRPEAAEEFPETPLDPARRRMEIAARAQQAETEADSLRAQSYLELLKAIPTATATLGGLAGGVRGAAVGGAAGRIPKEIALALAGETPDVRTFVENVANEGANQALLEVGGRVLVAPLRALGGRLAGKHMAEAAKRTRGIYHEATQRGTKFSAIELMKGLPEMAQEAYVVGEKEAKSVLNLAKNFMSGKGKAVTPVALQQIKQIADSIADPIFKRLANKNVVIDPSERMRARFYRMVGDQARTMLRTIPGAEAAEAATRNEIKRRELLFLVGQRAAAPAIGGAIGAAAPAQNPWQRVGQAAIGAGLGAAAAPRGVQATVGQLASNPALLQILSQLPRAGAAAMQGQ